MGRKLIEREGRRKKIWSQKIISRKGKEFKKSGEKYDIKKKKHENKEKIWIETKKWGSKIMNRKRN